MARRWVYVPYDQLSPHLGALAETPPDELGIVLVESPWKAARRPYHRQKLALILANQRHFAREQRERGVEVRQVVHDGPYADALRRVLPDTGPLEVARPAEYELRRDLAPLFEAGQLRELPHDGWLTRPDDFHQGAGDPYRMDRFYRHVRRRTGILMEQNKPVGGRFSFDGDNRKPWKGQPPAPTPPTFPDDPIKRAVRDLIERDFAHHPGQVDLEHLPATQADAQTLWNWALEHCLPHFGTYEDAMSTRSRGLFHTRVSPLLHLHRLLPRDVLTDVLSADIPLNAKEGFVRQLLGWREFVHHVHEVTDGLRSLTGSEDDLPGDAGWERATGSPWPTSPGLPGGARPDTLHADVPLPPVLWGNAPSGLNCLDRVVEDVWAEAWGHHITRLMVIGNLATLLGWNPRELTDWFWVAYMDAFDWVVEPNVLGMATFAIGDVMTTKPYVSGAAYIDRMSDYCKDCAFHPKKTCPITPMYWAFLNHHADALASNHRLKPVLANARRRTPSVKGLDTKTRNAVRDTLARGEQFLP